MAQQPWTPRLTRGLWGVIQSAVRDGVAFADVGAAARAAGQLPDASTIAHLYSRAVGGRAMEARETDYRSRVDRSTYLARRPGGEHIAPLPRGFALTGRYRQVVQVFGTDALTGQRAGRYVNVQFDRLLSRGEAIDLALGAVQRGSPPGLIDPDEAEYVGTWRPG